MAQSCYSSNKGYKELGPRWDLNKLRPCSAWCKGWGSGMERLGFDSELNPPQCIFCLWGVGCVRFRLSHPLHNSQVSYSFTEGSQGKYSRQEPGSRSWCRSHGGVLLTGLLLMACSPCFLIKCSTIRPGMASPIMDWCLPHQTLIKKMPYRPACSRILWRHFLN